MIGDVLAIIPARGGSKGLPGKNVTPLRGKPLIAWTIEAARQARRISRVVVSTDSPQIADAARAFGAEVPFLRPDELARDDTPAVDAALHALDWLLTHERYEPDWVALLQPTSPLRVAEDIDACAALAAERDAAAVVSVTPAHPHPYWARRIDGDGQLSPLLEVAVPATRQSLPDAFSLNGAVYLVRTSSLRERRTFHPPRTWAYVMPRERSIDVDSAMDLRIADALWDLRHTNPGTTDRTPWSSPRPA